MGWSIQAYNKQPEWKGEQTCTRVIDACGKGCNSTWQNQQHLKRERQREKKHLSFCTCCLCYFCNTDLLSNRIHYCSLHARTSCPSETDSKCRHSNCSNVGAHTVCVIALLIQWYSQLLMCPLQRGQRFREANCRVCTNNKILLLYFICIVTVLLDAFSVIVIYRSCQNCVQIWIQCWITVSFTSQGVVHQQQQQQNNELLQESFQI